MSAKGARPIKFTFAGMRGAGVRGLLISCADYRCSHSLPSEAIYGPMMSDLRSGAAFFLPGLRQGGSGSAATSRLVKGRSAT
jgi:hypothetical protein